MRVTVMNEQGMKSTHEVLAADISDTSLSRNPSALVQQLGTQRVQIISRAQWGADESLRIYKSDRPPADIKRVDPDYAEKFSDELMIVRRVEYAPTGEPLTWPLEYPEKISKIIIHHTASTADLDNPKLALRNIYYWHAIGRGWGDIGYNYIIDPQGNIYEGRAGGEGVIGGHAGKSNTGSIGISIMGNYEKNDITDAALISLMKLIGEKAKIHGIDPSGKSMFRGELTPNVMGHRDVMQTACPGEYVYKKLATIRGFSSRELATTEEKPQFKRQQAKGFNYEDQSQQYYLSINPEEVKKVPMLIKNTGTVAWSSLQLVPEDASGLTNVVQIHSDTVQSQVLPGATVSLNLEVTGGVRSKYQIVKLAPLINGRTKLEKVIVLPVNLTSPVLKYEFVQAQWPNSALRSGEKVTAWVDLKNTGNVTWSNKDALNVRLGTDRSRDRKTLFTKTPDTRIAFLTNEKVAPGQIGHFVMNLRAPQQTGSYSEYMTPVAEGISWFADTGLHFETFVYDTMYDSQILGINIPLLKPAETAKGWIRVRNTGGATWDHSITLEKQGISTVKIANLTMDQTVVKPGQDVTLNFDIIAPKASGKKEMKLRLKIDEKTTEGKVRKQYLQKKAMPVSVIVRKKAVKIEAPQMVSEKGGNDVRVLLAAFDGTSAGGATVKSSQSPIEIHLGKNLVTVIPQNQEIRVNYGTMTPGDMATGKYTITSGSYSTQSDDFIRLVPQTKDAVLELVNFERRETWNPKLNNNFFRGTLEIRMLEGKLRVINELSIENYLKGLAEITNDTPIEKTKAIIVAARTYAYYYSNIGQKFPGKPYHLDDDPNHTQKYRGYGYETRAPNTTKAVVATSGMVITYNGQAVLAPYFSSDDGRTRSGLEAWGWKNTPYLQSVADPHCKGLQMAGHGVGMSGCGSLGLAKEGKTFDDILHYYYQGIVLRKMY